MSYYGARYYDAKTSLWLNVDPLATYNPVFEDEFYFDGQHNGGIYYSGNLNSYAYCYQNPIKYIDPNGKQVEFNLLYDNWPKNDDETDDKNNIKVFKSIWGDKYNETSLRLEGSIYIENACATRGSIALGLSKIKIPQKYADFYGFIGGMKDKPITSTATKMLKVMKELYKNNPEKITKISNPKSSEAIDEAFNGKKGMYIMIAKDGSGYTGHVGLYDGDTVLGGKEHYYVEDAKEVYLFKADEEN